jgi:drug/metabolite transporter (DMT)-like permease
MRVIPTRIHGMMDYVIGVLLIAAPWLFGFHSDGADTWVPVILGAGLILYSLFTDYELGAVRRLSMPTHLMLDLGGGVLLAISPWLFGFSDRVWAPHLIVGLIEIGTSLMTRRVPADGQRAGHHGATVSGRPSGAFRS